MNPLELDPFDTVTTRAMHVCAARNDSRVNAYEFCDLISLLVQVAVRDALAQAPVVVLGSEAERSAPATDRLAPREPDPADDDDDIDDAPLTAVEARIDPPATVPAANSEPERQGREHLSQDARNRIKERLREAIREQGARGLKRLPLGSFNAIHKEFRIGKSTLFKIRRELEQEADPRPNSSPTETEVRGEKEAAATSEDSRISSREERSPAPGPPAAERRQQQHTNSAKCWCRDKPASASNPWCKLLFDRRRKLPTPTKPAEPPGPKHRALTEQERAELERRYEEAVANSTELVPAGFVLKQAGEYRVPIKTIYAALNDAMKARAAAREQAKGLPRHMLTPPARADRYKSRHVAGKYGGGEGNYE